MCTLAYLDWKFAGTHLVREIDQYKIRTDQERSQSSGSRQQIRPRASILAAKNRWSTRSPIGPYYRGPGTFETSKAPSRKPRIHKQQTKQTTNALRTPVLVSKPEQNLALSPRTISKPFVHAPERLSLQFNAQEDEPEQDRQAKSKQNRT